MSSFSTTLEMCDSLAKNGLSSIQNQKDHNFRGRKIQRGKKPMWITKKPGKTKALFYFCSHLFYA